MMIKKSIVFFYLISRSLAAQETPDDQLLLRRIKQLPQEVQQLIFNKLAPSLDTWELRAQLPTADGAFSLDPSARILTYRTPEGAHAHYDTHVRVHQPHTTPPIKVYTKPTHYCGKKILNISPNNTRIVVYDEETTHTLLMDDKGVVLTQLTGPHTLFSQNSQTLVAYTDRTNCALYKTATGKKFTTFIPISTDDILLSPDGKKILYTVNGFRTQLRNLYELNTEATENEVVATFNANFSLDPTISFSPCSKFLLCAPNNNGSLGCIYTIATKKCDSLGSIDLYRFSESPLHQPHFITNSSIICLGRPHNQSDVNCCNATHTFDPNNPIGANNTKKTQFIYPNSVCFFSLDPHLTIMNLYYDQKLNTAKTYENAQAQLTELQIAYRNFSQLNSTKNPGKKQLESWQTAIKALEPEVLILKSKKEEMETRYLQALITRFHNDDATIKTEFIGEIKKLVIPQPGQYTTAITQSGTTLNVYRNKLSYFQALFKTMVMGFLRKNQNENQPLPPLHARELLSHSILRTFAPLEQEHLKKSIIAAASVSFGAAHANEDNSSQLPIIQPPSPKKARKRS